MKMGENHFIKITTNTLHLAYYCLTIQGSFITNSTINHSILENDSEQSLKLIIMLLGNGSN